MPSGHLRPREYLKRLHLLGEALEGDEVRVVLADLIAQSGNQHGLVAVLDGLEAVYVDQIRHNGSARGRPFPAHATSLGKALPGPPGAARARGAAGPGRARPYTAKTITDPARLAAERTSSHNSSETIQGLLAIGIPPMMERRTPTYSPSQGRSLLFETSS